MVELHILDMSCGHCGNAIQNAILAVDQSAKVEFDMESRNATIRSKEDTAVLIDALTDAGYSATTVRSDSLPD